MVFTHGLGGSPRSTARWATRPAATITWGLEVLVQLVMAATTTAPSSTVGRRAVGQGGRARPRVPAEGRPVGGPGPGQGDQVLGPGRPGDARDHRGQVELDGLGVDRLDPAGHVEHALLLGVGLDQVHVVVVPAGEAQVVEGHLVDGEDGAGGPVLGGHVADGGPVGQRHGGHAGAVELDELAHHAVLAEQVGDGEHQVGGGGARAAARR